MSLAKNEMIRHSKNRRRTDYGFLNFPVTSLIFNKYKHEMVLERKWKILPVYAETR
jgi:hypothetical protein